MRKESLNQRAARSNMPVGLRVTLTLETRALIEGLAKQVGITTEEAVAEAISDWRVRREQSANRKTRLGVEKALEDAKDRRAADEVIADFKQQMRQNAEWGGGPEPIPKEGLTDSGGSCITQPMPNSSDVGAPTLRQRREALGLSREKLAHKADISSASIEQFEAGARPKRSKALERLEATLREQERIAA